MGARPVRSISRKTRKSEAVPTIPAPPDAYDDGSNALDGAKRMPLSPKGTRHPSIMRSGRGTPGA
jgi:hypothetical protein